MLMNLLLQKRQWCTASSSSSMTQPRWISRSPLFADGGRNAFRLQPTQVRTAAVDKMNVVIEQRAMIDWHQ